MRDVIHNVSRVGTACGWMALFPSTNDARHGHEWWIGEARSTLRCFAGNYVPGRDGLRTAQPILRCSPAIACQFVGCAEARSASRRSQALARPHPQRIEGEHLIGWMALFPSTHGVRHGHEWWIGEARSTLRCFAGNYVPGRDGLRTAQPILRCSPAIACQFVGCAEARSASRRGFRHGCGAGASVARAAGRMALHPPCVPLEVIHLTAHVETDPVGLPPSSRGTAGGRDARLWAADNRRPAQGAGRGSLRTE